MINLNKNKIIIPNNIKIIIEENIISIIGPLGTLKQTINKNIRITLLPDALLILYKDEQNPKKKYYVLTKSLINNMIFGVINKYSKTLTLVGTNFKISLLNNILKLNIGYTHSVNLVIPNEVFVKILPGNKIYVESCCKETVGKFSALIKSKKKPEPYKGKGFFFEGETIIKKVGKKKK